MTGTKAAIAAGYSEKTASRAAAELMANPKIKAHLQKLRAEVSKQMEINTNRVLQEYARIAFANFTDVASFDCGGLSLKSSKDLPEEVLSAIAGIDSSIIENETGTKVVVKVRMHDKLGALDRLAKYLGLLDDMNVARAAFQKYGYVEIQTDRGFEYVLEDPDRG